MTNHLSFALLRSLALASSCALIATACSSGGGSTLPSSSSVATLDSGAAVVASSAVMSAGPILPLSASGVATYAGCPIFTAGDWYNADVTNATVDPHSTDYIASISATDNTGFYASTGIEKVNLTIFSRYRTLYR